VRQINPALRDLEVLNADPDRGLVGSPHTLPTSRKPSSARESSFSSQRSAAQESTNFTPRAEQLKSLLALLPGIVKPAQVNMAVVRKIREANSRGREGTPMAAVPWTPRNISEHPSGGTNDDIVAQALLSQIVLSEKRNCDSHLRSSYQSPKDAPPPAQWSQGASGTATPVPAAKLTPRQRKSSITTFLPTEEDAPSEGEDGKPVAAPRANGSQEMPRQTSQRQSHTSGPFQMYRSGSENGDGAYATSRRESVNTRPPNSTRSSIRSHPADTLPIADSEGSLKPRQSSRSVDQSNVSSSCDPSDPMRYFRDRRPDSRHSGSVSHARDYAAKEGRGCGPGESGEENLDQRTHGHHMPSPPLAARDQLPDSRLTASRQRRSVMDTERAQLGEIYATALYGGGGAQDGAASAWMWHRLITSTPARAVSRSRTELISEEQRRDSIGTRRNVPHLNTIWGAERWAEAITEGRLRSPPQSPLGAKPPIA
jgi:hypothetical protein